MKHPAIGQYIESVGDPHGRLRTLRPVTAELGDGSRVRFCAGRNAVVFRVVDERGGRRMLKCFLRPAYRGRAASDYLLENPSPIVAPVRYLEGELYVFTHLGEGEWRDVAEGPWTEGTTLETRVAEAARREDRGMLAALALSFDTLALALLECPWAHGDLKPENIIVGGSSAMRLVDYDALFIPALRGGQTAETGTPAWQHPARDGSMYDGHLDDYPAALISVSLHALARDPGIYSVLRPFEGWIMHPPEVVAGRSPGWETAMRTFREAGDGRLCRLAEALRTPSPRIAGLREMIEGG